MNRALFQNLTPPRAPQELRARVLEACRLASDREPRHWVDRIWENSTLRLVWVALTLMLLIAVLATEGAASGPGISWAQRSPATFFEVSSLFGAAATERPTNLLFGDSLFSSELGEPEE